MFDGIVVGAGVAGCVAARELAEAGKSILILEKREHIGGNTYDEKDAYGVLVHRYGPHIFHTDKEAVFSYLSRFTDWYRFEHQVVANVYGRLLTLPFNLNTLFMVYDEEKAGRLEKKLTDRYPFGTKVPILKLMEQEDRELTELADYVYEHVFLHYTMKQWGKRPEEISPEVTARVPVLVDYDNRYFQEPWQGVPKEGFTALFKKMLSHENITVRTGTDAGAVLKLVKNPEGGKIYYKGAEFTGPVIYTGPLDGLFNREYGRLPYRSLDFVFEHYKKDDYQGHSVVNYTVEEEFTRITEFKHLTGQQISGTTIVKEYPRAFTGEAGQIPYYCIDNPENRLLYGKYRREAEAFPMLYLLGRLAEYKYYNIDAMVEKALNLAEELLDGYHEIRK